MIPPLLSPKLLAPAVIHFFLYRYVKKIPHFDWKYTRIFFAAAPLWMMKNFSQPQKLISLIAYIAYHLLPHRKPKIPILEILICEDEKVLVMKKIKEQGIDNVDLTKEHARAIELINTFNAHYPGQEMRLPPTPLSDLIKRQKFKGHPHNAAPLQESLNGELPDFFYQDPTRQAISWNFQKIKIFTPVFDKLPDLKGLDLAFNEIDQLPDQFQKIPFLILLDLRKNKITELPPSLQTLKQLKNLYLNENQMKKIPDFLALLPSTCTVNLRDNPIDAKEIERFQSVLAHIKQHNPDCGPTVEFPTPMISEVDTMKNTPPNPSPIYINNRGIPSEQLSGELPDFFYKDPTRQVISWNFQKIKIFTPVFDKLPDLKVLDLAFNKIDQLPDQFQKIPFLRVLDLRKNKITELPPSLQTLKQLKNLYLNENQIKKIPDFLALLPAECKVDLTGNPLDAEEIKRFELVIEKAKQNDPACGPTIEFLIPEKEDDLPPPQKQNQKGLPDSYYEDPTLVTCNHEEIENFDPVFVRLPNLKGLDLAHNKIREVPDQFQKLPLLKILYLENNQITVIPPSVSTLNQLKELNFSRNKITKIPDSFALLPSTCKVDLTENPLEIEEIQRFKAVLEKAKQNNPNCGPQIQFSIPQEQVTLTSAQKITPTIELSIPLETPLNTMPFLDLPQLKLPPEAFLSKMTLAIVLPNHEIEELPNFFDMTPHLEVIQLPHNRIQTLPPSLSKLTNLKILDLSHNLITRLPEDLLSLPRRCKIYLKDNPLLAEEIEKFQTDIKRVRETNPLCGPQIEWSASCPPARIPVPSFITKIVPEVEESAPIGDLSEEELSNFRTLLKWEPGFKEFSSKNKAIVVSSHGIKEIPDLFHKLPQLQLLHLSGNQISTLPPSLATLPQLQLLDLSDNQITHIPDFLAHLPSGCELNLRGNPLSPSEIERFQNVIQGVKQHNPHLGPQLELVKINSDQLQPWRGVVDGMWIGGRYTLEASKPFIGVL